jgi:hypothetical protein
MNAVDPVRKLRALSAESRVLRRGVLGDRVDGRSREGRFLSQIERELIAQVGKPNRCQHLADEQRLLAFTTAPFGNLLADVADRLNRT